MTYRSATATPLERWTPWGDQPATSWSPHSDPSLRAQPIPDSFCDRVLGTRQPATSDGGSTDYYRLPKGATELNDLIEHKRMSFALGNIFKACYRFGEKDAASRMYDLNKIIYFAERLKALEMRRVQ